MESHCDKGQLSRGVLLTCQKNEAQSSVQDDPISGPLSTEKLVADIKGLRAPPKAKVPQKRNEAAEEG